MGAFYKSILEQIRNLNLHPDLLDRCRAELKQAERDRCFDFARTFKSIIKETPNRMVLFDLVIELLRIFSSKSVKIEDHKKIVSYMLDVSTSFDTNMSLYLLQYCCDLLTRNKSCFYVYIPVISFLLFYAFDNNPINSSTALAYFQQLFSAIICFVKDQDRSEADELLLGAAKSELGSDFSSNYDVYSSMISCIINDIICISANQKPSFIVYKGSYTSSLYDIEEIIFSLSYDFNQTICTLFECVVIQQISNKDSMRFIAQFIYKLYDDRYSFCKSVLLEFFDKMLSKNEIISLFFFHYLILNSDQSFLHNFREVGELLCVLKDYISRSEVCDDLLFKMRVYKSVDTVDPNFNLFAPYEIAFCIVKNLATNVNCKEIIEKSGETIFSIIKHSFTASSHETFSVVLESLHDILCLFGKYSFFKLNFTLSQLKNILDSSGCPIKRLEWGNYIPVLLSSGNVICNGNWSTLIMECFRIKEDALQPTFANGFTDDDKFAIYKALVEVEPLPGKFIALFMKESIHLFSRFFEYTKFITKKQLVPFLVRYCLNEETEMEILTFVRENMDAIDGFDFLDSLRSLIKHSPHSLSQSWPLIINLLDPNNFKNSQGISTSFDILNIIAKDCFSNISDKFMLEFIDIIFKFALINDDINMSLSSLDMIWVISPYFNGSNKIWTHLFDHLLLVVSSNRASLSESATCHIFVLLSSNTNTIPHKVLETLINDMIPSLLGKLDPKSALTSNSLPVFLTEISCFLSKSWYKCSEISGFKNLINAIIEKNTIFITSNDNEDVVPKCFEFYHNLFESSYLNNYTEALLLKSLEDIIIEYKNRFNDQNCFLYAKLGSTLGLCIQYNRKRFGNGSTSIVLWMKLLKILSYSYKSDNFVHITLQRYLSGLFSIIPLPIRDNNIVNTTLVEIIKNTEYGVLRQLCINSLINCFPKFSDSEKVFFYMDLLPLLTKKIGRKLSSLYPTKPVELSKYSNRFLIDLCSQKSTKNILAIFGELEPIIQKYCLIIFCEDFNFLVDIYNRYVSNQSGNSEIVNYVYDALLYTPLETDEQSIRYLEFLLEAKNRQLIMKLYSKVVGLIPKESPDIRTRIETVLHFIGDELSRTM